MTPKIHWLGAGLSSAPGIKRLAQGNTELIVWNRSLEKARQTLKDIREQILIQQLDWSVLNAQVNAGDVVISMLPATLHIQVAELCLENRAHFVSSSYIAPQMAELNPQAKQAGLCLVNEVGLDPGLDHLFAHSLVEKYQQSEQYNPAHRHSFRSYCGGFPKIANDFRYKFSWSPLGVLKALKSPACWLANGEKQNSGAPWEALSEYQAQLSTGTELFQAYPNRDSLPFVKQYHFGEDWNIQEFVRGTLRLNGWSQAWQSLFDEVGQLPPGEQSEQRLREISQELEKNYAYEPEEPDRVVLCVELEVCDDNGPVWHQSYQLDEAGNQQGQAMARLVSVPVSLAVESVLAGEIPPGVSAAPDTQPLLDRWLQQLTELGENIHQVNHL